MDSEAFIRCCFIKKPWWEHKDPPRHNIFSGADGVRIGVCPITGQQNGTFCGYHKYKYFFLDKLFTLIPNIYLVFLYHVQILR